MKTPAWLSAYGLTYAPLDKDIPDEDLWMPEVAMSPQYRPLNYPKDRFGVASILPIKID